jgi:hypothetical protein
MVNREINVRSLFQFIFKKKLLEETKKKNKLKHQKLHKHHTTNTYCFLFIAA